MAGSIRPRLASAVAKLKEAGAYDEATAVEALTAPRGYLLLQRSEPGTPSPLSLMVSKTVRDELRSTAEEMDQVLDSLAAEAYRLVLAGEWLPPKWQKPGRGLADGPSATFQVVVDADLRRRVQEILPRLTEEAGYRVMESSIVITHLCDELGVDRGVGSSLPLVLPEPLRDHFVAARDAGVDLGAVVDERVRQMLDGSWELPRPGRVSKGTRQDSRQVKLAGVHVQADVRSALPELAASLSEKFGIRVFPGTIVRGILTDRLGEPAE